MLASRVRETNVTTPPERQGPQAPSCADPVDVLMPVTEARAHMLAALAPVDRAAQRIPLSAALGRVLASPVVAGFDVPSLPNSAMDGYAIAARDIPASGSVALAVAGHAWAGHPFAGELPERGAVRIFTGAIMPVGTDTVVMQERVRTEGGDGETVLVHVPCDVHPGRNVRAAGEDVALGEPVFTAGQRLGAADIGVLASLGVAQVEVHPRLRVAVFTTGDELVSLDETSRGDTAPGALAPGLLYDSNRYTLVALLSRLDVETIDLGIVADTPAATRAAFDAASERADLIISSGGISTGEADHVREIFHERGEIGFWRLAMRPGRPLAFGRIDGAVFFGLPGNPVAVMVTFLQFVQPALRTLGGERVVDEVPVLPARCTSALKKAAGRTEFLRGIASLDDNGELSVSTTGPQGAGRLSSMAAANCLIVIEPDRTRVEPGERVGVQLLHGLLP